jgi:hypothetical protein
MRPTDVIFVDNLMSGHLCFSAFFSHFADRCIPQSIKATDITARFSWLFVHSCTCSVCCDLSPVRGKSPICCTFNKCPDIR